MTNNETVPAPVDSFLRTTLRKRLLQYAVGRVMFCRVCDTIADCRRAWLFGVKVYCGSCVAKVLASADAETFLTAARTLASHDPEGLIGPGGVGVERLEKLAKQQTRVETRARCFRGANGGVGILATYRFLVDADGTVRVYDSIARHYTVHHGMAQREESRVRNLARAQRARIKAESADLP